MKTTRDKGPDEVREDPGWRDIRLKGSVLPLCGGNQLQGPTGGEDWVPTSPGNPRSV